MKKKLKILLVDDHQMFRDALRSLLEMSPHLHVVAEAGNGQEAVKMARATQPEIVCMDIGLPGMNGIEATRAVIRACPDTKVIAVSAFAERRYVEDMFDAGAAAFVAKSGAVDELQKAITAVRSNRKYLCPMMASVLADSLADSPSPSTRHGDSLGSRERQVLQLVAEGYSSAQIADQLNIAHSTVDVHRRNIMRKLNLHSVAELTRFAINSGLVPGRTTDTYQAGVSL